MAKKDVKEVPATESEVLRAELAEILAEMRAAESVYDWNRIRSLTEEFAAKFGVS